MARTLTIPDTAPLVEADNERDILANWQTAFVLKPIAHQRQVYTFESELRLLEKTAPTPENVLMRVFQVLRTLGMTTHSNIETEHNLKAAIRAGWVDSPVCEVASISPNGTGKQQTRYVIAGQNVDDLHPGKVRWYGQQVESAYNAAVAIPDPNS